MSSPAANNNNGRAETAAANSFYHRWQHWRSFFNRLEKAEQKKFCAFFRFSNEAASKQRQARPFGCVAYVHDVIHPSIQPSIRPSRLISLPVCCLVVAVVCNQNKNCGTCCCCCCCCDLRASSWRKLVSVCKLIYSLATVTSDMLPIFFTVHTGVSLTRFDHIPHMRPII
ncbi:conserved hypothetical protein [Trichinella spiralis]|uniref:hypothetical protein n=1 Tax=Trichinella spiralis TaxID=6334 RepID=UPI0001EFE3F7|nr:conserved hypothetical protein [Trichinella spiralis]